MAILGGFAVPHPPLIIPQIGKGEEQQIKGTIDAYHQVARMIADLQPDTIVVISPHAPLYADYLHISPGKVGYGNFRSFGCPDLEFTVKYDTQFIDALVRLCEDSNIPAGTLGERSSELDHGSMIPLYFINQYYHNYSLVRISISGLPFLTHFQLGTLITKTSERLDKRVVIVASGDLSHKLKASGPYGYAKEGPEFDQKVISALKNGDLSQLLIIPEPLYEAAAECGLRSLIILAGALNQKDFQAQLLSYEGTFGVGYAVASFILTGESNHNFAQILEHRVHTNEDEYVALARKALEYYVQYDQILPRPADLSAELLNQRAGVFVSLHIGDQLRGCIGTIKPTTKCIADEIIRNAVLAGCEDPRFYPVQPDELPYLIYSVDVLTKPEPVQSLSELDPKRYGIIVSCGNRQGLLLPDLPGINDVSQQLEIALRKAGIAAHETYKIERFEVVRHT